MGKAFLIDGYSILNRAFYGVNARMTGYDGLHTNGIFGFLNIVLKQLREEEPDHIVAAFDVKAPTFRHKMYEAYKGTRKGMPEELKEQVEPLKELLAAMNIPSVSMEGYEADDILGTLSLAYEQDGNDVIILSGDRDMLQLASDRTMIRIPRTKGGQTTTEDYHAADVERVLGVTPTEFIDVKALMGDSSDNIPGVAGIGEKTAYALIKKYHSLDAVFENAGDITPARARNAILSGEESARLSYKLALIDRHVPLASCAWQESAGELFTPEAYAIMQRMGLKSFYHYFSADAASAPSAPERLEKISDAHTAERLFAEACSSRTAGLQIICGEGRMFGAALSYSADAAFYIEINSDITQDALIAMARGLCGSACTVWTFELKEQLAFLGEEPYTGLFDAQIAAYLLDPLGSDHAYSDVAARYLGLTLPSRKELLGKTQLAAAAAECGESFIKYCCYTALTAARSGDILMDKLSETGMAKLFTEMEMPLVYSLFGMERAGIRVNGEELKAQGLLLGQSIDELEAQIYELAGEKFNINSPKQLGTILFEKLGLKGGKKTKTGYSTSADILEKLAPKYPIVQKILDHRQLKKLKSTYTDGLYPYICEDGRIHGHFNQTVTATGRISSTEPNLQNIPVRTELGRQIRKVFVPADGCVFIDADYSQIELRVLAHMSEDEGLINAYRQAQDIHSITASQVFHVPLKEVTPQLRRSAKAVNFGIVYGISAFGLGEDLGISRSEAADYIDRYFETYPGVKAFLDGQVRKAKEEGKVTTLCGRVRPVPELSSSDHAQRSFGERVAMNSPIQGTAADIIKIAMINVDRALREEGLSSRIVLQVHDELLVEAPAGEKEQVKAILEREMKNAMQLDVPLEISLSEGASWYETK